MKRYILNSSLIILLFASNIKSQTTLIKHEDYFNSRLSIKGGIGHIVVKDEFISKEKYSGNSPYYIIDWSNFRKTHGLDIAFEILNSATLKNNNVSAQITEFSFNFSYLYSIGKAKLFNKNLYLLLGPTPELFLYFRNQNIARGGNAIMDAYSGAVLISLGMRFNLILSISRKIKIESYIRTGILSLGGKLIDPRDTKNSPVKLLTLFSGMRTLFELSLRYNILNNLSLSGGYIFNLARLTAWDYLISASDKLFISTTYSF